MIPQPVPMVLWAIDEDATGPVAAHRIVQTRGEGRAQVRVTACGRQLNILTHPTGWWNVPKDELPLAEVHKIHCGLQPQDITVTRGRGEIR